MFLDHIVDAPADTLDPLTRATLAHESDQHRMQCMEVWGGNQAIDNGVSMPGIDAWVYSRPFQDDASGGDVHYVSSCATGRITRLLVADVSGHGASVSNIAMNLRGLMRRYVNFLDQTRFVQSLNREFLALARQGGFATSVVATYWAPTDHLVTCNAGHPRPLWFRARMITWQLLTNDARGSAETDPSAGMVNLPLGILEPTAYEQFGVKLSRGDLVVIYTDSLIEARNQSGRQLGENGLLEMARRLDPSDPRTFIDDLLAAMQQYRADGGDSLAQAFEDDVTILLLRPNGSRPRQPLHKRLAASVRFMGMALRSLLPGVPPVPWPEWRIETIGGAFFARLNQRWLRSRRREG